MISRQHVEPDFFAEAEAMRGALDECFKDSYAKRVNWHYFSVPKLYTYLRTAPQGVIPEPLFARFTQRLRGWCMENLGLTPTGTPNIHMMVNGCKLELHSDFHNGTWGYVYSLTRWQNRKFLGGETLLMRDGVPSYKKHHVQGDVLYELIPAHFNQLLVFDDRIAHGTPVIEGNMDPLEARIAMVGHLRATSPVVSGALQPAAARATLLDVLPRLADQLKDFKDVQGTITFKLSIASGGTVESIDTLTDNIITQQSGYEPSEAVAAVKTLVQRTMADLRFARADRPSSIIVPVLIPLPDLRPIEIAVPHELPREALYKWVRSHLGEGERLGLHGAWEGEVFVVDEPIAGSLRVEPRHIAVHFDPPMWVPSQREKLQARLTEQLRTALAGALRR
jgi:hypothetical protein